MASPAQSWETASFVSPLLLIISYLPLQSQVVWSLGQTNLGSSASSVSHCVALGRGTLALSVLTSQDSLGICVCKASVLPGPYWRPQ